MLNFNPKCDVETSVHEHVRIVGPIDLSEEALATLHSYGFVMTRIGPYTDRATFPKVDASRFLFIGERELEREE